jgi:hypothetical protein
LPLDQLITARSNIMAISITSCSGEQRMHGLNPFSEF